MRSRIWPFLALVLVLQQVSDAGRVKRAANTNCQTNPSEMDSENVVDDADTLSMSCNNDAKVVSCIWRHTDPISEKVRIMVGFILFGNSLICSLSNECSWQFIDLDVSNFEYLL
jgi:hypothetical protein